MVLIDTPLIAPSNSYFRQHYKTALYPYNITAPTMSHHHEPNYNLNGIYASSSSSSATMEQDLTNYDSEDDKQSRQSHLLKHKVRACVCVQHEFFFMFSTFFFNRKVFSSGGRGANAFYSRERRRKFVPEKLFFLFFGKNFFDFHIFFFFLLCVFRHKEA